MTTDTHTMDVVFRKDNTKGFKGTIFALLPHECCDLKGHVTTYQHVGQHSEADYKHCIATSNPATSEEYADLKKEMESIGYRLNVVHRQHYAKYLKSYRKVARF